MLNRLAALTLVALLALSTGCSSFEKQWREHQTSHSGTPGLVGQWQGRWQSDANGHAGDLRCIITHQTNQVYTARFHATYRRLFNLSFGYTTTLDVSTDGAKARFHGSADLGWYAGGVYRYEGHADGTNFFSTYSSKHDKGTFEMSRPTPP